MLIKLIKNDIARDTKSFLGLAGIAFGISVIVRMLIEPGRHSIFTEDVVMVALFVVTVAAIIRLFYSYKSNIFGKTGYLSLTLPIPRSKLLTSKLIVAMMWIFLAIAIHRPILVLSGIYSSEMLHVTIPRMMALVIDMSAMGFFAISVLFFCITLAHSSFRGRRIHGIIAGSIGLGYGWLMTQLYSLLGRRGPYHFVEREGTWTFLDGTTTSFHFHGYFHVIDIRYGRIFMDNTPWGMPVFIDLFQIGMMLGLTAAAIVATRHLLKRMISLR